MSLISYSEISLHHKVIIDLRVSVDSWLQYSKKDFSWLSSINTDFSAYVTHPQSMLSSGGTHRIFYADNLAYSQRPAL